VDITLSGARDETATVPECSGWKVQYIENIVNCKSMYNYVGKDRAASRENFDFKLS
jgi:hypothetical protein